MIAMLAGENPGDDTAIKRTLAGKSANRKIPLSFVFVGSSRSSENRTTSASAMNPPVGSKTKPSSAADSPPTPGTTLKAMIFYFIVRFP